jgi:hypothetical protein
MVVNVMTKDHTIESRTHCIAAIWLTRIREGRMSTSICFRTSKHGRAESWRVCYRRTVDGLDRSKIEETAPGWRSVGLDGNTPTKPDQTLAEKPPPGQSDCRKRRPGERRQAWRNS